MNLEIVKTWIIMALSFFLGNIHFGTCTDATSLFPINEFSSLGILSYIKVSSVLIEINLKNINYFLHSQRYYHHTMLIFKHWIPTKKHWDIECKISIQKYGCLCTLLSVETPVGYNSDWHRPCILVLNLTEWLSVIIFPRLHIHVRECV